MISARDDKNFSHLYDRNVWWDPDKDEDGKPAVIEKPLTKKEVGRVR